MERYEGKSGKLRWTCVPVDEEMEEVVAGECWEWEGGCDRGNGERWECVWRRGARGGGMGLVSMVVCDYSSHGK